MPDRTLCVLCVAVLSVLCLCVLCACMLCVVLCVCVCVCACLFMCCAAEPGVPGPDRLDRPVVPVVQRPAGLHPGRRL